MKSHGHLPDLIRNVGPEETDGVWRTRRGLLDAVDAVDAAIYAVHAGAPDSLEKLQAALRQVVLLYGFGIAVQDVEDDIAAATRLHAKVGRGECSVIRDHEVGLLRSAAMRMRDLT